MSKSNRMVMGVWGAGGGGRGREKEIKWTLTAEKQKTVIKVKK